MFHWKQCLCIILLIHVTLINSQSGPDPWHYERKPQEDDGYIPPDIKMQKSKLLTENKLGVGELFFRRMLALILKGGQTEQNEDGSVDISLSMRFESRRWKMLDESLKSETPLSEDLLRRTMGYVQESIYKPSIIEKVVMAWSDYVQIYLTEYKMYIIGTLSFLGGAGGLFWIWNNMSHKHVIILLFIIFYSYEVIISYKEAEQKELEKFLTAVDRCDWFFWKSTCDVPPPDPLIFIKHMNPLKIAMRMFTTALAEPIVVISGTVEVILKGITNGLIFPFDKIVYAVLVVIINISIIFFFIMILFNWILNTPFGFFGISIKQRKRNLSSHNTQDTNIIQEQPRLQNGERLSQETMNKILDVCSLALSNTQSNRSSNNPVLAASSSRNVPCIRRSASTGRLPIQNSFERDFVFNKETTRRKPHDGSGDK